MELTHDFTVPASVDDTWAALTDIEGVAGCFPGATITGAEADSFEGSVKVKLGPIALTYNGAGSFVERDESGRRMRIDAKGKDKRGNGTASADVVASLERVDATSTRVTVETDLSITGKPAQFGRGVIQDVSDKLLAQFVDCLAERIGGVPEAAAAPEAAGAGDVEPGPARMEEPTVAPQEAPVGPPGPAVTSPAGAASPSPTPGERRDSAESLDLGATLLPVLLRSYGKQAAATLGVLVLLWWVLRRRS